MPYKRLLFIILTLGLAASLRALSPGLNVGVGPFSPSNLSAPANATVTFLQVAFTNVSSEPLTINSLTLQAAGTADDTGLSADLYLDGTGLGVASTSLASGIFSLDNGSVLLPLSPALLVIAPGATSYVILEGTTGPGPGTLQRILTSVDATGQISGLAAVTAGLPVSSGIQTLPLPLSVAAGPSNPPFATVTAGASTVPVLQFIVTNQSGEGVILNALQLQGAGSAYEPALAAVRLWQDLGPDGYDTGDSLLMTETFAADNGLLTINGFSLSVSAGQSVKLLITYDTDTATGTHLPSLQTLSGQGINSAAGVTVTGLPLAAGGLNVVAATFTPTPTPSLTQTPSAVVSPTRSGTPSATLTRTPPYTATPAVTATPSATLTRTPPYTATPVATTGVQFTPTLSPTPLAPVVLSTNIFHPRKGPLGISLQAAFRGHVTVRVFSLAGVKVRTPFEADLDPGTWVQAHWDGDNQAGEAVASGLYVVSVRGAGIDRRLKVVLIR